MRCGPGNHEVGRGFMWPRNLGTNPRVARRQGAVLHAWPVSAYGLIKPLAASRVDCVIDVIDPLNIGAKFCLSTQVESEVHTQAGMVWGWVNQMGKRRAALQAKVAALAEIFCWDRRLRNPFDVACQRGRVQTRGVDEYVAR